MFHSLRPYKQIKPRLTAVLTSLPSLRPPLSADTDEPMKELAQLQVFVVSVLHTSLSHFKQPLLLLPHTALSPLSFCIMHSHSLPSIYEGLWSRDRPHSTQVTARVVRQLHSSRLEGGSATFAPLCCRVESVSFVARMQ